MNEGMAYTFENNAYAIKREAIGRKKPSILAKIAVASFVSHMELVAMHSNQKDTSKEDISVIEIALNELQLSGEIKSSYAITDQQNVIIGYELAEVVS